MCTIEAGTARAVYSGIKNIKTEVGGERVQTADQTRRRGPRTSGIL